MENYIIFEEKKHYFLSNSIFLLKEINNVCTFIHNQIFKYIVHTIGNMKIF